MKDNNELLTLGIETSCDETSAAVIRGGREALSNVISSQIDAHKVFGGVVPEIASRHHLTNINAVLEEALSEAGITFADLDIVGVTKGPGLVGAVLIGLSTAKALALAIDKPLVGVHHIGGHVCAAYLEHPDLKPPFLSLIVSGGHTDLIDVKGYREYSLIGHTRDDAAGEAFDKVARVLGLGYPGGPAIDAAAREGDPEAVFFKRVMLEKDSFDFSFSGLKTAVLNYVNTEKQAGREVSVPDVAAGFEASVVDVIVAKAMAALERTGYGKLAIGGGVASNSLLRSRLAEACGEKGTRIYMPSPLYCTDNAAMIACAAHYDFISGRVDGLDLDASASLPL